MKNNDEKQKVILSLIEQAKEELELNRDKAIKFDLAEGFGRCQFDSYLKQKIVALESRVATFEEVLAIFDSHEDLTKEQQTYVVWTDGFRTGSFTVDGTVESPDDLEEVRDTIRRNFEIKSGTNVVITFYKEV